MSTARFGLLSFFLFALAFIAVSWAHKGFPVLMVRDSVPDRAAELPPTAGISFGPVALKPSDKIPTFHQLTDDEIRRKPIEEQTNQSDGNKERDALRLALLQASTAYKLSPCDGTMKKNLISAVINYATAWQKISGCYAGCNTTSDRLDQAAAAFQTPADKNVRKVLHEAFEQGGLQEADFPKSLRSPIYTFGGGTPFGKNAACGGTIDTSH